MHDDAAPGLLDRGEDGLHVERLERGDVDDIRGDALLRQVFEGPDHNGFAAHGDNTLWPVDGQWHEAFAKTGRQDDGGLHGGLSGVHGNFQG